MNSSLQGLAITEIIKDFTLGQMYAFCKSTRLSDRLCNSNKDYIREHFVKKYIPDWEDRTNFIYIIGGATYGDWKSIFNTYLKYYNVENIRVPFPGIGVDCVVSSVPIFPNMRTFYAKQTHIRTFPVQPKMTHIHLSRSRLSSFPVQPEMLRFNGNFNYLASFPVQPKMIEFHGRRNTMTSFPTQPEMTYFDGRSNPFREISDQPKVIAFYINAHLQHLDPRDFVRRTIGASDNFVRATGQLLATAEVGRRLTEEERDTLTWSEGNEDLFI